MRTAVITDIHGDHAGLLAVLADSEQNGCDRVVCLGDLLEGAAASRAVAEEILARGISCVRGNHEAWHDIREELTPELEGFLRGLPEAVVEGDTIYTHISPRPADNWIRSATDAWFAMDGSPYRLAFVGHVHFPALFGMKGPEPFIAVKHEFSYGSPFRLNPDDRYIICVGPVGYSRDGIDRPRYAIYDAPAETVEMRIVST